MEKEELITFLKQSLKIKTSITERDSCDSIYPVVCVELFLGEEVISASEDVIWSKIN